LYLFIKFLHVDYHLKLGILYTLSRLFKLLNTFEKKLKNNFKAFDLYKVCIETESAVIIANALYSGSIDQVFVIPVAVARLSKLWLWIQ